MPTFSIVIPSFESSKTIDRTIRSLQSQTFKDFEVIITDDASTDYAETLEIIKQYPALKIDIQQNITKTNGAYARNCGIKRATGKYIAFLDADDSWPETRLASALKSIEELTTNRFVLYGQFELIQDHKNGAFIPRRAIGANELVSEYVFAAGQLMQTSTFICPREVALDVMFDEQLTRHQDSDFMMRAQHQNIKLVFENSKCANYYITPVDVLQRIQSGRISVSYCHDWLTRKQQFFSKKSIAGYNLTVTARILYLTGKKKESLWMATSAAFNIGLCHFIELICTKAYVFIKLRIPK